MIPDRWPQKSRLRATIWAKTSEDAEEPAKLEVFLEEAFDDEKCPLTLEPIREDELDFMPGVSFLERYPTFKKMTLPCGHSFGAMTLTFYFGESNLICPCCRRGVHGAVDIDLLPQHFRARMSDQLLKVNERTKVETNAEDRQSLVLYFRENVEDLDTYMDTHTLMLAVLIYTKVDQVCESFQTLVSLVRQEQALDIWQDIENPIIYRADTEKIREMAGNLSKKGARQLSLATFARKPSGTVVNLDATSRFDWCAESGAKCDMAGRHGRGSRYRACFTPPDTAPSCAGSMDLGTLSMDSAAWAASRDVVLRVLGM